MALDGPVKQDDTVSEQDGIKVVIDRSTARHLREAVLDYDAAFNDFTITEDGGHRGRC